MANFARRGAAGGGGACPERSRRGSSAPDVSPGRVSSTNGSPVHWGRIYGTARNPSISFPQSATTRLKWIPECPFGVTLAVPVQSLSSLHEPATGFSRRLESCHPCYPLPVGSFALVVLFRLLGKPNDPVDRQRSEMICCLGWAGREIRKHQRDVRNLEVWAAAEADL